MFTTRFLDIPPLDARRRHGRLPGSKSISNRALLLAAHSRGDDVARPARRRRHARDARRARRARRHRRAQGDDDRRTRRRGDSGASAELFLGNAGTAMRPLDGGARVRRRAGTSELAASPRMRERPIGDLVDALSALGCAIHYLGNAGYPPLAWRRRRSSRWGAVRVGGDVSSQFLTALLMALPLVARRGRSPIEVDGELISKPYVDITLRLMARFGVPSRATAGSASHAARQPLPLARQRCASRATHRRRRTSSRRRDRGEAAPLRIEGVGADSMQGDIALRRRGTRDGRAIDGGDGWMEVRRGTVAASRDRSRLQPHAGRRDDGPSRALRERASVLSGIGAGASRRPTGSPPWRPSCASSAPPFDEGRLDRRDRPDGLARAGDRHVRRSPHRDVLLAGRVQPRSPGRAATAGPHPRSPLCRQDLSRLLRGAVRRRCGATAQPSRDRPIDGPTASGKGTLASASPPRSATTCSTPGALYRAAALAALRAGVDPADEAGLAELAVALDLRFAAHRVFLDGAEVAEPLRARGDRHPGVAHFGMAPRPGALRDLSSRSIACRGSSPTGATWAPPSFQPRELKIFLTPEPPNGPSGGIGN